MIYDEEKDIPEDDGSDIFDSIHELFRRRKKNEMKAREITAMFAGGSGGFSDEYNAVLNQATSLGYTKPSRAIQVQQDIFIRAISSIWSKIITLRIFATNQNDTSAFSLLNLKNPSANLGTTSGTITYSYGGWKGNGTDGYINLNINPTAGGIYTQNSAFQAFFIRKRSESANNALAGVVTATTTQLRNASTVGQRLNSGGDLSSARDLSGEGFKLINRPDANNLNTYDDLVKTDIARTSFTLPNENMLLFRANTAYGDMEMSFHAAGSSLTEAEENILRNAWNAYYTAIWDINMNGVLSVYYIGGQSNCTGRGVNASIAPELNGAVGAKVFELAPGPFPGTINNTSEWQELTLGDNQTTETPSTNHGTEMRFGYNMYHNVTTSIGIVKFGIGATSMAVTWSVGGSGNLSTRRILTNYAITDIWDTLRLSVNLKGAIWIQGESDCVSGLGAAYGTRYEAMILDFLTRCNNAGIRTNKLRWMDLLTKNGGGAGYDPTDYANVIAGKIDVMNNFKSRNPSASIMGLTYQSTDDIPLLDTQHYSTSGLDTLGTRMQAYFSQYINE